jgi:ubiquinone/menaquinone biosynthesis C-methylase UbiE
VSTESFRPLPNTPPTTFARKLTFFARLMFDLQVSTVYRDLRRRLPGFRGDVLDVGCGLSPYRFLLDARTTQYVGVDILDAERFDYANPGIVSFDGEHIPFPDGRFDAVICTEVLEHVANYQQLVDEIHRVMKVGAEAIVTVPWSARFHYVPYDFFRYTPSSLSTIFAGFAESSITPRGTDISVIASKLAVLWFRNAFPKQKRKLAWVPLWVLVSPLFLVVMAVAHLCTWTGAGSSDDPLGYTIVATK